MTESGVAPSASEAAIAARRAELRGSTEALQAAFPHELNIAYGDQPLQVLDLYLPATKATAAP